MTIEFSKIKLVVWDLDDTFWKGTLSEGGIEVIEENISLVKRLTDIGIVNSICSKNDGPITFKTLESLGISDFFVFKSIDWTPKGQRISTMIKDMGLRNVNVLFLDDNSVNLNEASHYCPGLMVADPAKTLPLLISWAGNQEAKDLSHKRLNQYKVLETKVKSRGEFSDNLEFLFSTKTVVQIHKDCLSKIDRIYELIHRTNQLNYTKKRIEKTELEAILKDESYDTGYVTVKDKFGDYGIVGFFAIKGNIAEHFLFSCRAIGQGVEQWVYSVKGFPHLDVSGEVITKLEKVAPPEWINADIPEDVGNKAVKANISGKVLFKGPCDLMSMTAYMSAGANIIEEFNYVSPTRHNLIMHHNHSTNILNLPFYSEEDKKILLEDCIFNDEGIFRTELFSKDLDLVFLSTFHEPNWGIYKRKDSDICIAYGPYTEPLTDPRSWEFYLGYKNDQNTFTREWLSVFASKYIFLGRLSPAQSFENIKKIYSKISPSAKLCIMLGSETPYKANTIKFREGREIFYKELNGYLKTWARGNNRVCFIDFNDFITGQNCFDGNINHFTRGVYFKAATRANEILEETCGIKLKMKSLAAQHFYDFLKKIRMAGSRVYHKIKG